MQYEDYVLFTGVVVFAVLAFIFLAIPWVLWLAGEKLTVTDWTIMVCGIIVLITIVIPYFLYIM